MISVCFQGKPFSVTVIQVYAPTSNAEEAEVERFYSGWQEKAMAPHSSTLAWKNPWMEEPDRLQSMGSQRSRGGLPLWTKVMRKEARHTQMRDRASGVHPDILAHLPPKKTRVCLLYCFVLSPVISLGAVPHHHLALSVKELTYSSNS